MKIFKRQYVCFNYGTIGDTLMEVAFLEEIQKQDKTAVFILGVFKNFDLINNLVSRYDWLKLYDLSKKIYFVKFFLRIVFSKVFLIGPFSFNSIPKPIIFFEKAVSIFNSKHSPINFSMVNSKNEKYFTKTIPFNKCDLFINNLSNFLPILGLKQRKIIPHFDFIFDEEVLKTFNLSSKDYVAFHICAANEMRSLPISRWVKIVKAVSENTKLKIVFTASKQDVNFVNLVVKESGVTGIIFVGKNIHDVATIVRYSKLYIGVDTGITHIAAVMQVPSIIIANNSNPTWLPMYNPNAVLLKNDKVCSCDGLKGGNCSVDFEGKKYYKCMFMVSDEEIITAILNKLK